MRRVGVRPWTATIVACILVFLGSGYQNIVFPFQITLVGSLVFGLTSCCSLRTTGRSTGATLGPGGRLGRAHVFRSRRLDGCGGRRRDAAARGWRLALIHTVPLAAVYAVWYGAIGHVGYDGYRAGPGQIASFVRTVIAAIFRGMGNNTGVSLLIGLLLISGLIVAWRPLEPRVPAPMPIPVACWARGLALHHGPRPRRPRNVPGEEPLPPPRDRDAAPRDRRSRPTR